MPPLCYLSFVFKIVELFLKCFDVPNGISNLGMFVEKLFSFRRYPPHYLQKNGMLQRRAIVSKNQVTSSLFFKKWHGTGKYCGNETVTSSYKFSISYNKMVTRSCLDTHKILQTNFKERVAPRRRIKHKILRLITVLTKFCELNAK